MTLMLDPPMTSTVRTAVPAREAVATGLLVDAVLGTNGGVAMRSLRGDVFGITTIPVGRSEALAQAVAAEVRQLREQARAAGVRQHVLAQLLGVDRRSLSGWASGQIRPGAGRLAQLRSVARVINEIHVEHHGRAAEVLAARRGSTTLLDAVVSGTVRLDTWRAWFARSSAHVTVANRRSDGDPIWAAAARALAEGRLHAPTSERTLRPESTYEMDAERHAAAFAEPEYRSGRRGI